MHHLLFIPLFLGIGAQELLLIAVLILLFFGGKKIPELMKGLGKGVKSFKDGMSGIDPSVGSDGPKEKTKDNPNSNTPPCESKVEKDGANSTESK